MMRTPLPILKREGLSFYGRILQKRMFDKGVQDEFTK